MRVARELLLDVVVLVDNDDATAAVAVSICGTSVLGEIGQVVAGGGCLSSRGKKFMYPNPIQRAKVV